MICAILWKTKENGRRITYRPGDHIGDDHPKAVWLKKVGIAADDAPVDVADPEVVDDQPDEPVDDLEDDGNDDPEPLEAEPGEKPSRPNKVAKLEVWQAYAKAHGVDTKGMKKDEIIAHFI